MPNVSDLEVNMLKNISTLAVSIPINLSIKLGLVYVNGDKKTYFVDALHIHGGREISAILLTVVGDG